MNAFLPSQSKQTGLNFLSIYVFKKIITTMLLKYKTFNERNKYFNIIFNIIHHHDWILDEARRRIWGEIVLSLREKPSGFLRTFLQAGFPLYNLREHLLMWHGGVSLTQTDANAHAMPQTLLITVKGQFMGHYIGVTFLWVYNLRISVSQVSQQQSG